MCTVPLFAVTYPTLPQASVDVTCCAPVLRTVPVHTAAQFQAALSSAHTGDDIVLDAGSVYEGNFVVGIPVGTTGWVTVRSSLSALLPPPGTRVGLKDIVNMAKIKSPDAGHPGDPSAPALGNDYNAATLANTGVNHYRFIGLEFATGLSNTNFHVVWFSPLNSTQPSTPETMPHDIIIDRSVMHGNDPLTTTFPNGNAYLNGSVQFDVANGAIVDSYIYNLWGVGVETQALTCGGGPGPRLVQNNLISGGTEAFMCGGSVLPYSDRIPTDITVTHNYFTHPISWMTSAIVPYVKNLFELKVGNRVRLTDNVFENSWDRGGGQLGSAIVLTTRSWQDSNYGDNPSILAVNDVSDVLVANNVIRNVGLFLSSQMYDNYCYTYSVTCIQASRYLISDNLADYDTAFYPSYGGMSVGSMSNFSVKRNTLLGHNTGGGTPSAALFGNRTLCSDTFGTNFEWNNNINLNGVEGDCEYDPANLLITSWLGDVSVTSNLVANVSGLNLAGWQAFGHASQLAGTEANIGLAPDELTLSASSPYYGMGIGASLACFNEAAVRAGTPSELCPLPTEVARTQSITFGALSDVTFSSAPITLSATSSAGLTVTLQTSTGSVCAVSGVVLTLVGSGTCSITASQAGDPAVSLPPALPVTQTFLVARATPVITWAQPVAIMQGEPLCTTQLSATANVSGTFAYSPASGTVLPAGSQEMLQTVFTPANPAGYNTAPASTMINVKLPLPVSRTGGPYHFCPNVVNGVAIYAPWYVDGTRSTNPDDGKTDGTPSALPGSMVAYDWNFGGADRYNDGHGAQVRVDIGPASFLNRQGQSFPISLRVVNNDNLAFPAAGLVSGQSGMSSGQVFVHEATDTECTHCVSTLSGKAKTETPGSPGNIQLFWGDAGTQSVPVDHYNVYRSANADFSVYQQIAGAVSVNGVPARAVPTPGAPLGFVDAYVVVGSSYYYRVAPATSQDVETCGSNMTIKITLQKGRYAASQLSPL